MSDHNATIYQNSGYEREIKGGRGPWIERTYPKGAAAIAAGVVCAIGATDGLVAPYDPANAELDQVKGVALEDRAAEAVSIELLVLGTVNRGALKVGAAAPTTAQLLALEDRHIYAVG